MRWARVPETAVKRLTPAHLRVYAALAIYADQEGECWPSQATIAAVLGITTRGLQKHLQALEAAGFIVSTQRAGQSSVYRLTDGSPDEGAAPTNHGSTPEPQVREPANPRFTPEPQVHPRTPGSSTCEPQVREPTNPRFVLTDQEHTNNTPGVRSRPSKRRRTEARSKKFSSLEEALSQTHNASGLSYREHFEARFNPPLDGRNFRPTVDEALEAAWSYHTRPKKADTLAYLTNWLRNEAERRQWSYDRELRFAPQNDDENGWERDAQRALEEMGHG